VSISNRQKKRLINLASLIDKARGIAGEFEERNQEYTQELHSLVTRIKSENSPAGPKKSVRTAKRRRPFKSKFGNSPKHLISSNHDYSEFFEKNQEEFEEAQSIASNIDKTKIPPWAKDVWRKIMMFCHPDRISKSMPKDEIRLKKRVLDSVMKCYQTEAWDEILFWGVFTENFTEKLSMKKQMAVLTKIYANSSKKIEEIQNTVSWNWGVHWDDEAVRLILLINILKQENIVIPSNEEMLKLIRDLEAE